MKQNIIIIAALFVAGTTFYSCQKKEQINPITKQEMETEVVKTKTIDTDYFPEKKEDIKVITLEFLNSTKTYANTMTRSSFPDKKPNEGKWVMESASNYLVNKGIKNTTSNEVIETSIEITNTIDPLTGDVLMSGTDMSQKFDALHTQINTESTSKDKTPKLIDVSILEVSDAKTILKIRTIIGTLVDSQADNQWPIGGMTIFESTTVLEEAINNHLQTTTTGVWMSNVSENILAEVVHMGNQGDYGCSDCLWETSGGWDNCITVADFEEYYQKSFTLINGIQNSITSVPNNPNYVTTKTIIEVDYFANIHLGPEGLCGSYGNHIIENAYAGYGNAY